MNRTVCPNCGQWQHATGDCLNDCTARGFVNPYPGEVGNINDIPGQREFVSAAARGPLVPWDAEGLEVTRLRLLSDPGFPFWDVSYCVGRHKGSPCRVELPFDQLPKRGMRRAIVQHAIKAGVHARRLGILDNISTLI